ncbi:hypothetical protein BS78_02G147700 [Paspalum vaginatum]|nr:hypothetical protein BS78_02G147700 [Paspalum vaginatum]
MSPVLPQLHGSQLPSQPASSCSFLLQPWQRSAGACVFGFRISRAPAFTPCFLLCGP